MKNEKVTLWGVEVISGGKTLEFHGLPAWAVNELGIMTSQLGLPMFAEFEGYADRMPKVELPTPEALANSLS
jgi:hypothetical protein